MSAPIDNGGYAFPNTGNSTWNVPPDAGMSLRDWLISQAPFMMIDASLACGFKDYQAALMNDQQRATMMAVMAVLRCEYADAMIAARKEASA